jgi:hypothetical protein
MWFELMSKEQREAMYLDWINNYLSIERFAEDLQVTYDSAEYFINIMRNEK